jgi:hypothetical protein
MTSVRITEADVDGFRQNLDEWGYRAVGGRAGRAGDGADRARGDSRFRAFTFDLLRIGDGGVAEITTFDSSMFDAFGLPPELEVDD